MTCACEELGLNHGYLCGSPGCYRERERLKQVIKMQALREVPDSVSAADKEQVFRNALIVIADGNFSGAAVKAFAQGVLAHAGVRW